MELSTFEECNSPLKPVSGCLACQAMDCPIKQQDEEPLRTALRKLYEAAWAAIDYSDAQCIKHCNGQRTEAAKAVYDRLLVAVIRAGEILRKESEK